MSWTITVGGGGGDRFIRQFGGLDAPLPGDCILRDAWTGGAVYQVLTSVDGLVTYEGGIIRITPDMGGRIPPLLVHGDEGTAPSRVYAVHMETGQTIVLLAHEGGGGGGAGGGGGSLVLSDWLQINNVRLRFQDDGSALVSLDLGATWIPAPWAGGGSNDPNAPYLVLWSPINSRWETTAGTAVTEQPAVGARVVAYIAFVAGVTVPAWFRSQHDLAYGVS